MPSEQDIATQLAKERQRLSYNPVSYDNVNEGVQGLQNQEEASEEDQATELAKQQQLDRQDSSENANDPEQNEKRNHPSIMLSVALALCLVRDAIWMLSFAFAAMLFVFPPAQFIPLGFILIADLAILPIFFDRKFIIFLTRDFVKAAVDPKDAKKNLAKSAATKLGLSVGEFLLLIIPFIPFYSLILGHYIGKFREAPYIPDIHEMLFQKLHDKTIGRVHKAVDKLHDRTIGRAKRAVQSGINSVHDQTIGRAKRAVGSGINKVQTGINNELTNLKTSTKNTAKSAMNSGKEALSSFIKK